MGPVRRDAVGAGRSARNRIAACSCRGNRRPADQVPQNERNQQQSARQGTAPDRRDRAGPVRRVRLRRARSSDRAEGLLRRSPGRAVDAAEMGARLHAVASHARRRNADAEHHRHVPREADSARRGDLSRHRVRAARMEHEAAVVRLQSRRLQARPEGRARRHARPPREGRRPHGPVGSRSAADAARHDSRREPGETRGRLAHSDRTGSSTSGS